MVVHEIGRQVDYRPVEPDGAATADAMIAGLLKALSRTQRQLLSRTASLTKMRTDLRQH